MRTLGTWEENWKLSPNDTLSFFFFHRDTIDKYSWEEIRQYNKTLVRYDIGTGDLMRLPKFYYNNVNSASDPVIIYPPTEQMRFIRMYPPYEKVMEQYEEDCRKIAERESN